MSLIFDTHAHYDDHAFDEDRDALLKGLIYKGVGNVVNAGAAARSIPRILSLTDKYDFMYMAAGLHPCECYGCGDNTGRMVMDKSILDQQAGSVPVSASGILLPDSMAGQVPKQEISPAREKLLEIIASYNDDEIIDETWVAGDRERRLIEACMEEPKVVCVGEIGLDYHYDDTQKEVQKDWFAYQIDLAKRVGKPINVHSRDAAADTLDMLKAESARDVGGIIHCFSYGKEMAKEFLDLGFMLGIGGVVTFKNSKKVKEVVGYMPMDRLVLETDCPYLAPTPFRGERNDSSMISYAAEAIAQIKGLSPEEVIAITEANAKRVYGID